MFIFCLKHHNWNTKMMDSKSFLRKTFNIFFFFFFWLKMLRIGTCTSCTYFNFKFYFVRVGTQFCGEKSAT